LSIKLPDPPQFGDPLPPREQPEVLAFLARRRSVGALLLRAPGPSREDVEALLRLATRVPDHGKLFPWRFMVLQGAAKADVATKLTAIAQARPDATKALAALGKLTTPPLAVCVVSRFTEGEIPEWEQRMSAGAVCLTLLQAATADGYGACWITDWYAYDEATRPIFGLAQGEKIAGFIYIGTPSEPPLERARPNIEALISRP